MSKYEYTVTKEDEINKKRVKDIIRLFDFSARLRSKLKHGELVFLNGRPAAGWLPVLEGDVVSVAFPEEASDFEPEDIPIAVIYEDSDIHKTPPPPGHVVHPTKGQPRHTMANGIQKYVNDTGQSFKIRFVNRLDRDTSGLMIVAKNSNAQDSLSRQMSADHMNKTYIAVVKGCVLQDTGTVDVPIGRPDPDRVERGVMTEGGQPSVTHFTVLERFSQTESHPAYSLVKLRLETGRTHQIRVHMAYIGHPVAGDHLYGGIEGCEGAAYDFNRYNDDCERDCSVCRHNGTLIRRQALHAASLDFTHPVTGEPLHLEAPLPEDLSAFIEALKRG